MKQTLLTTAILLLLIPAASSLPLTLATQPGPAALPHAHAPQPILMPDPAGLFWSPEDLVRSQVLSSNIARYTATSVNDYQIDFRCPPNVSSDIEDARCPAYVLDLEDIMSQPVLLVDQANPQLVAFNAMHGIPGERLPTSAPAPSEISRNNVLHQPHTTFQSQDTGAAWRDNRYYSRLPNDKYDEVFGEDNAAALDSQGRIVLASLYAYRENSNPALNYTFLIWKSENIESDVQYDNNWVPLRPRDATAEVRSPTLVMDAKTNQMALFWLEGPAGAGRLEGVFTDMNEGAVWKRIPETSIVSPCSAITNAVESTNKIYIGCFAAERYPLPPDGGIYGDLMIHRFDPSDWNQSFQGVAPISVPSNAVLASAESWTDNGLIVAGAGLQGNLPILRTSMGADGKHWSATANLGDRFTDRLSPGRQGSTLVEARITAAAYVSISGTIHFLYQERYAAQTGNAAAASPAGPGPFWKTYGVSQAGSFLGRFDFGHGDPQARVTYGARAVGSGDGVFGDRHDSLVVVRAATRERIFMAAGDHGYVRFAEVFEDNPPTPPTPLVPASVPIPAPIPAINPALVGAVAGALSLSIVARMAASRNKKAAETPSQ